ncbi:MAG: hypothetical protein AUK35_08305 [Zetaproteobacteria bacterium CG2_30_46_52]|nr:MAG: hypothetical protein AUK35_08305 [Zetaproteobacteria bacterium CG2_30_46_52]
MADKPIVHASKGEHVLIILACLVIVIAGLKSAAPLFVPLLVSAFLAIICLPPLYFLLRRGFSTAIAVSTITLGLLILGLLLAIFAGASVADFSNNIPMYQSRIQSQMVGLLTWLQGQGLNVPKQAILDSFDPSIIMKLAGTLLSSIGNMLTNAFMIVLIVIFLLVEAVALPHKWEVMDGHAPNPKVFKRFLDSVHKYVAIKSAVSLATGAFITVWLTVLGVEHAILWGLIAFLFNFVPNIGSIIAAVPAVLLALVQLGVDAALLTALGFVVVNIVMGNVIEPKFMGKGVGLSTLVVFLSLVIWGWVLGPVGMLLSVPLTMIVKFACEAKEETQWIAVLLGPDISAITEKETTQHE